MISHNIFDLELAKITLRVVALIWLSISLTVTKLPTNGDSAATIATEPLPFINAINTNGAITAEDDPYCIGQKPTVWYSLNPSENMRIQANSFGSDYDIAGPIQNDLERIGTKEILDGFGGYQDFKFSFSNRTSQVRTASTL